MQTILTDDDRPKSPPCEWFDTYQDRQALARAMADKLMAWKLPENFGPDCFITFDREAAARNPHCWPVGTNLFTHEQAVQMLLDIMPVPLPTVVQVPQGWRLVPVEPTIQMIDAAKADENSKEHPTYWSMYSSMLSAAPEAIMQDETEAEKQVNCAEEILDGYAAHLDLKETSFDCIGDYITAVCEALKGKS